MQLDEHQNGLIRLAILLRIDQLRIRNQVGDKEDADNLSAILEQLYKLAAQ